MRSKFKPTLQLAPETAQRHRDLPGQTGLLSGRYVGKAPRQKPVSAPTDLRNLEAMLKGYFQGTPSRV